jgi:phosphatidate phosphatase APP1
MNALYRQWQAQGAVFHYVSGSPWPLALPLETFLKTYSFPDGTLHLRHFRLKSRSALGLTQPPDIHKISTIENLLRDASRRSFYLVGDSGERDPEIYVELARKFPNQVRHIYIRDIAERPMTPERTSLVFQRVPRARWTVFRDPNLIPMEKQR